MPEILKGYFWVGLGSALGGMGRFWLSGVVAQRFGETFPWGTMAVNVSGSFVIGIFASLTAPDGKWLVDANLRQFVMIGLCGGYTTFSSFSIQTLNLIRDGQGLHAALNAVLSVVLCLVAVWAGFVCAQALNR